MSHWRYPFWQPLHCLIIFHHALNPKFFLILEIPVFVCLFKEGHGMLFSSLSNKVITANLGKGSRPFPRNSDIREIRAILSFYKAIAAEFAIWMITDWAQNYALVGCFQLLNFALQVSKFRLLRQFPFFSLFFPFLPLYSNMTSITFDKQYLRRFASGGRWVSRWPILQVTRQKYVEHICRSVWIVLTS